MDGRWVIPSTTVWKRDRPLFITEQGGRTPLQCLASHRAGYRRVGYMLALLSGVSCFSGMGNAARADDSAPVSGDVTNTTTRNLPQNTEIKGDLYQQGGDLGLDGVKVDGTLHLDGGQALFGKSGNGYGGTSVQSLAGSANGVLDKPPTDTSPVMTPSANPQAPYQGELSITQGKGETFSGSLNGSGVLSLLSGEQILTGKNQLTGTVAIQNGTLVLKDNGAIVSPAGSNPGTISVGLAHGNEAHMVMDGPNAQIQREWVTVGNGDPTYGQSSTAGKSDLTLQNGAHINDRTGENMMVIVGNQQDGTLNVKEGSHVDTDYFYAGGEAPATGTLNVSGKGASFEATDAVIGTGGKGVVTVNEDGSFRGDNVSIGDGGEAVVTVTSGGSIKDGTTLVGTGSHGEVMVTDGGVFQNDNLGVGGVGGDGTVEVGAGGTMDNGATRIGNGGKGVVTVVDGGEFQSRQGIRFGASGGDTTSDGTLNIRNHGVLEAGDNAGAPAIDVEKGAHGTINLDDAIVRNLKGEDLTSKVATTLAGTNEFNVQDGSRMTWTGGLSGSGGIVKTGTGQLALSDALDYTGQTDLKAGRLSLTQAKMAGDLLNEGGQLDVQGSHLQSVTQTASDGTVTSTIDNSQMKALTLNGGKATLQGSKVDGDAALKAGELTVDGGQIGGRLAADGGSFTIGGKGVDAGSLSGTADGTLDGTLNLTNASDTYAGVLSGNGGLKVSGGTETLSGNNSYTGDTTVSEKGGLVLDGSLAGTLTNAGKTDIEGGHVAGTTTNSGTLTATGGTLASAVNSGTMTLGKDNVVTGDVTQNDGQLNLDGNQIKGTLAANGGSFAVASAGSTAGSLSGAGNGSLDGTLNLTSAKDSYAGALSGNGGLTVSGGSETLTGNSSYKGQTLVQNGAQLEVDGDNSEATGQTSVTDGSTLRGKGTIGGDVAIGSGATLAPGTADAPSRLNINGNLTLDDHSNQVFRLGQAGTEGGAYNDFVNVKGNLALGGTLSILPTENGPDVQNAGLMPGLYRLYSYGGTLSGMQQQLNLPQGPGSNLALQTAVDHQVNLITDANEFNFWDGDAAAHRAENGVGNNKVDGGDGVWSAPSSHGLTNWTKGDGSSNAQWKNGNMAIFTGSAGVVHVEDKTPDNNHAPVSFSGMQFANTDDRRYLITGANLYATKADTVIRVGDGTSDGKNITAEIASAIDGSNVNGGTSLHKTDLGTLILSGDSGFARPTQIDAGTLQLGNGGTTGSIGTQAIVNNGTLAIDHSNDFTLTQAISGKGDFVQKGTGTTTLSGANTYTGDTDVQNGRLNLPGSIEGNLNNAATTDISGGKVAGKTTNSGRLTGHQATLADLANQNGTAILTDSTAANVTNAAGGNLKAQDSTLSGTLDNAGSADLENSKVAGTTTNSGTLTGQKALLADLANHGGTATLTDSTVSGTLDNTGNASLENSKVAGVTTNSGTLTGQKALLADLANHGGTATLTDSTAANVTNAAGARLKAQDSTFSGTLDNAGKADLENSQVAGVTTNSGTMTGQKALLADLVNHGGTATLTDSTAANVTNAEGATFSATGGKLASAANSGTMTLGTGNTVSGDVTQDKGSLTLDGNQVNGTLAANGGTFTVADAGSKVGSLSGAANGQLDGTLDLTNAHDRYDGSLSGKGGLTLTSGHETLTNQSHIGGTVAVDDGTLELSGQKAQVNAGGVKIGATGEGVVTLADGSHLQSTGPVIFAKASSAAPADKPNATLNVLNGSTLTAGDTDGKDGIRAEEGSRAQLTLNGGTLQNLQGSDLTSNLKTAIGPQGAVFDVQDQNKMTLGSGSTLTDEGSSDGQNTLTKTGTGTLFVEGDGSGFTGPTEIQSGTMVVDGDLSHSAVGVHQNALLAGTGTVGSTTVSSGGTLGAGDADHMGELHVTGDLSMAKGSVLRVRGSSEGTGQNLSEADGFSYAALKSDRILVSGKATLQGGTLDLQVKDPMGLHYGQAYRVLSAGGGVTGHYDDLQTNLGQDYAYLDPHLVYQADDVDVVLRRSIKGFGSVGQTRNEIATGNGLDHIPETSDLAVAMTSLTRHDARKALNNLSGEVHASVRTGLIQDSFYIRNAVLNRLANVYCDYGRNGQSTYDMETRRRDHACESRHTVIWGQAFGGLGHNSGNGNAAPLHHNTAGFVMGVDTPISESNWRVGGLLSYGHSQFNVHRGRSSSANSNNVSIGAYAGTHWGRLNLRLGAAYSWNVINTHRRITVGDYGGRVRSGYLGGTAQAFAELGYKIRGENGVFEPFMNATYVNLNTDKYREHGNEAALRGHSRDNGVTFANFGFRSATRVSIGRAVFMPHLMAAYRHGFGRMGSRQRESFVIAGGSEDMSVAGVLLSSNAAVVDAGVTARLSKRVDLDLSYIGQYGNHSTESGATGSIKVRF